MELSSILGGQVSRTPLCNTKLRQRLPLESSGNSRMLHFSGTSIPKVPFCVFWGFCGALWLETFSSGAFADAMFGTRRVEARNKQGIKKQAIKSQAPLTFSDPKPRFKSKFSLTFKAESHIRNIDGLPLSGLSHTHLFRIQGSVTTRMGWCIRSRSLVLLKTFARLPAKGQLETAQG